MELACRNLTEKPSEANLVKLLDLWSTEWKHQGRTRAVGPGAFDKYCTLGLFGHGGVCGVSNATARQAACAAVNHFLKSRFPQGAWASIAVLFNPHMGLHRDIQNMIGQPNHAIALGEFSGGRVWIEDDEGESTAWLEDKKGGRELRGRWLDMHDKPVSFEARILLYIACDIPAAPICEQDVSIVCSKTARRVEVRNQIRKLVQTPWVSSLTVGYDP
ncbi:hypothetical protein AK812_SmicGene44168 [Symbiodinium microadriaticum]|uniref:Uncharacterized protein n=1 Tax=Symbiodinium microadriaticum TaxID=2951 RepID=A0A1Q9BZ61_SYMMI|nr:hypothetical protein AK812_SmicGene44168 [Symbiodinium microadriaticum]